MRHFLAYLTANDQSDYVADFQNFRDLTRYPPGVDTIDMVIAVSRVEPGKQSPTDLAALNGLVSMANACPWINVLAVIWKGNVGRDFSSAEACLRFIGNFASSEDSVMVRNRSASGPFERNWYRRYLDFYNAHPSTGLVGSTINLIGHPDRPSEGPQTHVQTYIYLSHWKNFQPLIGAYPGARCTDRLTLILEGEIGLSRLLMNKGLSIACLTWPEHRFSLQTECNLNLPRRDIKREARGLPIRYRYQRRLQRIDDFFAHQRWKKSLRTPKYLAHDGDVPHVCVSDYEAFDDNAEVA